MPKSKANIKFWWYVHKQILEKYLHRVFSWAIASNALRRESLLFPVYLVGMWDASHLFLWVFPVRLFRITSHMSPQLGASSTQ